MPLPPTELGRFTWTDVEPTDATVVVPVGSLEQHGPHLPLSTDTRIAAATAERAVAMLREATDSAADFVLAPPIPYGASGEHESFPGTISIGQDALRLLLVELGRSATRWCSRIAVVNGHGGNAAPLVSAVTLLRSEGRDVTWFPCGFVGADAHAGRAETSAMLAIEPESVRMDRAEAGNTDPVNDLLVRMRAGGVRAVSANGVLGDPAEASARDGAQALHVLAEHLRAALLRWRPDDDGRLR